MFRLACSEATIGMFICSSFALPPVARLVVGVHHVADRLTGDGLQRRQHRVVVDGELVVDEEDALLGDQRRRVPGSDLVVDDVGSAATFSTVSAAAVTPNCWPRT